MKKSSIHHTGPISGLATFLDRYVATAGYDNRVILWDAHTQEALACGHHDHLANQCHFSPDGRLLVSASSDYTARIWSVPDMQLLGIIAVHADDVSKAAFSPDGLQIATSSFDGTLAVSDIYGKFKRRLVGHTGLIENFDWSPDGRYLLSCGMDGTIRTWDTVTGLCEDVKSFDGIDIDTLVILENGSSFAGNSNGTIACIDKTGTIELIEAHTTAVKLIFTDKEKTRLVSLGYDNKLHIWNIQNGTIGEKLQTSEFPRCIWARSASFLSENIIAFATFGTTYATYDTDCKEWDTSRVKPTGGINAVFANLRGTYSIGDAGELKQDTIPVNKVDGLCNFVVADRDRVFVGGQHGIIYDAITGFELFEHSSPLNCALIVKSDVQTKLIVGSYSGHIIVLNTDHPDQDPIIKQVHSGAIKGLAFKGGILASGTSDGEIFFSELPSLNVQHQVTGAHDGIVNDLCAFDNGFATVSRDLTLRLWNLQELIPRVFRTGHRHSIKCVASNARGDLIASGSYGGTVQILNPWEGKWVSAPVRPTTAGISSLTWDNNNHCFVAGSYDGQLYKISV